ncbi:MAG: MltA domain-containing protein [Alphaproteobacteria bacterium]|nr:MltA domain-containing protein [Alphaproteobacteria bacterium]
MRLLSWFPALLLVLLVGACAPTLPPPPTPAPPKAPRLELIPASFAQLPGWESERFQGVFQALQRSCAKLSSKPEWAAPCRAAQGAERDPKAYFESWFKPWLVQDNGVTEGLFTGYYEAELKASRVQKHADQVPLLGLPADLISADLSLFDSSLKGKRIEGRLEKNRLVPYYSRAEIEGGRNTAAPILAWADAVDAHILSIQGSGRLMFEDGLVHRLGFAASNGQSFKGIGKILKEKGKIPEGGDASMPGIERWLRANPQEGRRLMAENPRYIFFRKIEGEGPVGSLGVALTPERSLAVDPAFITLGTPVFLSTRLAGGQNFQRLMMAQDTGSAIKGVIRGDIFFGTGAQAYEKAGRQKESGRYWLLLPRDVVPENALRQ